MTTLARYDAACAALDAAVSANEVMAVRLEAKAIEAVARVAGNFDFEIKGAKLRTQAEARLGEMLEQGEAAGIILGHGGHRKNKDQDSTRNLDRPATLKEVGVSPKLATHARKLSGIGRQALDVMLKRFERESRERGRPAFDVISAATAKRNADSRRQLAQELSDCAALQPTGRKFPVCYADPAWARKAGIGNRAYENHYDTMSWDEIMAMPVAERMLPDSWLFLWIPRAHLLALHPVEIETPLGEVKIKLPLAWAIARAWGCDDYSTCNIWHKNDEWDDTAHGTGLIFWDQDEILCLFKRGRGLPMPDGATKAPSSYREMAAGHSAKPTYYRDMINRMTGGLPVLELFAREDDERVLPPNFYTWGNESKNTAEAPTTALGNPIEHDKTTGEVIAA